VAVSAGPWHLTQVAAVVPACVWWLPLTAPVPGSRLPVAESRGGMVWQKVQS